MKKIIDIVKKMISKDTSKEFENNLASHARAYGSFFG